jgi:uncharacterized protein (TIGR02145 family)
VRCIKVSTVSSATLPGVITDSVSSITSHSAICVGNITSNGGAAVTTRGGCWSTNPNPTLVDNHTQDGSGTGFFISNLTGLSPGTTYYVRAYATNSVGTGYGNEVFFTTATSTSSYPPGYVHCNPSSPTAIVDVTNPTTGKIWMDRNLGAAQAATSSTDAASYGDLYQWGRFADGHQCRTSDTTSTLSTTDQPGHGNFILVPSSPYDWRIPQNSNLWQGVNGVNNPCPTGYRLPTETEWIAERLSWNSNYNAAGAFASPLKLPVAGFREYFGGSLFGVGSYSDYWSSTVSGTYSIYLYLSSTIAYLDDNSRANGSSVRCIKD